MGGAVDAIVEDWLFVSRQRSDGVPLTFIPYSSNVGAVMVKADSPIATLADLKGKKLGIAGGPLDKGWLMLQAYAKEKDGLDLADDGRAGLRRAAAADREAEERRAGCRAELLAFRRAARGRRAIGG